MVLTCLDRGMAPLYASINPLSPVDSVDRGALRVNNGEVAGWLVVLVDNKEYVPVSRLRESDSGVINLTTILPDQDHATVEIFFSGPRYLEQIHTFHLSGLKASAKRPRIILSAHVRGSLYVTLRVDGEICEEAEFEIPGEVHRIAWWPIIVAAIAVLVIAALATIITLGMFGPDRAGDRRSNRAESLATAPAAETLDMPLEELSRAGVASTEQPSDRSDEEPREAQIPPVPVEETIYFEPESAELVTEAQVEISRIAEEIAAQEVIPEALAVVGHTALFGTAPARLALSEERAAAVANELRTRLRRLGVTEMEIRERGVGGSEPVTTAEDEQWQNRRVEISSP